MPSAWNAVTFSILKQHRGLSLDFGSLSSTRVNKQNKTKSHRLAPQEKKNVETLTLLKRCFKFWTLSESTVSVTVVYLSLVLW